MKNILKKILKLFSVLILRKYRPEIIAITGSVGKTSTKEAVSQILETKFKIGKTVSNYNNEIGVPLTIIGVKKSPASSLLLWIFLFIKALVLIILPLKYPKKLVLEFGADHKGDIDYLVSFIPIHMAILTRVSKVHLKYFKSISSVFNEKKKIFNNLNHRDYAIINNDDDLVSSLNKNLDCRVITYALYSSAEVKASDLQIIEKDSAIGMNFKLNYKGNVIPVFLENVLGFAQVYAFLAAASVALQYDFNLVEISSFAHKYIPPKGRTNLIKGLNVSYIIDDTYNSSPEAVKMSIDLLTKTRSLFLGRRIVVLGDMLELGRESASEHKEIGKYVFKNAIDILLTVGDMSRNTYLAAQKLGMKDNLHFKNQKELILYLRSIIKKDDLILVKGSQGSRMEKVVKSIMLHPELAKSLLVRQDSSWLK